MGIYTKYRLYKLQRRKKGTETWNDVQPLVHSIDGGGTMPLVPIENDSPDCGYQPEIEPQYRYIEDGTVCHNCD